MRFLSICLFSFLGTTQAFSQELTSTVYECSFQNHIVTTNSLRMKDYFDTQLGRRVGKIDLLDGLALIESTPVLVYQIPLWDQQVYIQIWYSPEARVDAEMSLLGSNKTFQATYHKGPQQQDLFCTTFSN